MAKNNTQTNPFLPQGNNTQSFDNQNINQVTQTSGTIPASALGQQPTLTIPEVNLGATAPLANQALASAEGQVAQNTKLQELQAQKDADQLKQRQEQESLIATLGGGATDILNTYNQGQGTIDLAQKEANDISSLIAEKTSAMRNQLLDEDGRRIPQAFITGRKAIIQQRGMADIADLSALLDVKNGQISNAQEKLKNSLAIKKEIRNAEIQEKQARVDLLTDITGESKEELQSEVDRLQKEADKLEKEQDEISSIMLSAMQAGAGADEIQRIGNAKSKNEAIAAATSLGRAAKMSYALQSAQLSKIRADIAASNSEGVVPDEQKAEVAKNKVELLKRMSGNKLGLIESVGTTGLGRLGLSKLLGFGQTPDFQAAAKSFLATDTLDTLIDIKARGATFGNLSDGERAAVGMAANALAGFADYDNQGNPTGKFKGSEEVVSEHIETIQKAYEKEYIASGGEPSPDMLYVQESIPTLQVNADGTISTGVEADPESVWGTALSTNNIQ